MRETEELTPEVVMEEGRKWIEQIIDVLPPEEVLKHMTPKERVAGLKPKDIMEGMEPDELEKLKAQLNKQEGQSK